MIKLIFSILVCSIFFTGCNGGGGESSSPISSDKSGENVNSLKVAGKSLDGEYFLDVENGSSYLLFHYIVKGEKITLKYYKFPYKDKLDIASFKETRGTITSLGDTLYKLDYDYETCGDLSSDEVEITGDPDKFITVKVDDSILNFKNKAPAWLKFEDVKMMVEDKGDCSTEGDEVTEEGVTLPTLSKPQMGAGNYSALLNQVQCRRTSVGSSIATGKRLSNIYTFNSSSFSGNSQTTIQGSFSSGGIGGSSIAREYIGVGHYGDVMIVQKVTNGSQVIGYNVLLSMCELTTKSDAPLISDARQLTSFKGSIVLDDEVSCGHGMIDASDTNMYSEVSANYSYLQRFPVATKFTSVGCISY